MSQPEDKPMRHRCLARVTAVEPEVVRMCRQLRPDERHSASLAVHVSCVAAALNPMHFTARRNLFERLQNF